MIRLVVAGVVAAMLGVPAAAPAAPAPPAPASVARATVREYKTTIRTYPLREPQSAAGLRAHLSGPSASTGSTDRPVDREWTVVELENPYLRVRVIPAIGGKVWTAIEKSTGRAFIYDNHVVKFRDIAMRGPWTSGGLEPNYGIIGHTPNCATPVDYVTGVRADGTATVTVGTLDLLTRTAWRLRDRGPARRGILHDAIALAEHVGHRAAVLHVDQYRPQGRGEPRVRVSRDEVHGPRGRGECLANPPREREEPRLLRSERLRLVQVRTTFSASTRTSGAPTTTTTRSAWRDTRRATRRSGRRSGSGACRGRG